MRQNRWPVSNLIVIGEKVEIEGAGRIPAGPDTAKDAFNGMQDIE